MDVNRGSYANLMINLIIWFYEKLESLIFLMTASIPSWKYDGIYWNMFLYFLGLALFREATWAPQLQVAEHVQPESEMEIMDNLFRQG